MLLYAKKKGAFMVNKSKKAFEGQCLLNIAKSDLAKSFRR